MGNKEKRGVGRPRQEVTKNRILGIRMTEDDYGRLIGTSCHYGIPIQDLINDALKMYYRILEED